MEHNVDIDAINRRLEEIKKRRAEIEAPIKKRQEQTKKAQKVLGYFNTALKLVKTYGQQLIEEMMKKAQ